MRHSYETVHHGQTNCSLGVVEFALYDELHLKAKPVGSYTQDVIPTVTCLLSYVDVPSSVFKDFGYDYFEGTVMEPIDIARAGSEPLHYFTIRTLEDAGSIDTARTKGRKERFEGVLPVNP